MSKEYESARLILELYDLRREAKMREARDWWNKFHPKSIEDINAASKGDGAGKIWMPIGYWDMAAALVNRGAIDAEMFNETNWEHMMIFAKLQPFLKDLRKQHPLLNHVEKLVMSMPDAQKRLDGMRNM